MKKKTINFFNTNNLNSLKLNSLTNDLKNIQSERNTFNISQKAIDSLNWLSKKYDISYKETIDACLKLFENNYESELSKVLLEYIKNENFQSEKLIVKKTFVLSKGAQQILNLYSKQYKIKKNILLDSSIIFLKAITELNINEDRKLVEKADIEILNNLKQSIHEAENKLIGIFGKDHDLVLAFGTLTFTMNNLSSAVMDYIADGTPIDANKI